MTTRSLQLFLAFAIGIAAAIYCYSIYSTFEGRFNYLTWDPAEHGWSGMRLALDIRSFNLIKLIEHTNRLVLWPPLHSYLQIPYFLLFGYDYNSSVLCSLTFLAFLFPALTLFYQQLDASWAGFFVLMALCATSPMILGYGAMPMLEIFGTVLTAVAASLFLRRSRWFPLSFALLFFLKYNYFFYLLLAVLLVSLSKDNVVKIWQTIRPSKTLLLLIATFCIFSLLILITGGFQIGSVSIRGIGNPAYILFLAMLIGLFWKRRYRTIWMAIQGTGWEWFVVPVVLWLIIPVPNRIKTIVSFAINRPLGSPPPTNPDYYLYYFQKLPLYYADQWLAWASLILLIAATVVYWKKKEIVFASGLFVLPFLLMTINQNKQERYLFTFIPALWILLAYMFARIPKNYLRFAAALTICATAAFSVNLNQVRETIRWQFAPLRSRAPLNFIAERIGEAKEVRVLGTTNDLNPASIQYHSGLHSGFSIHQNFDWNIERDPGTDLHIVCIYCDSSGKLLRSRKFQDGTVVRHYFLDTPNGAPYNPNQ